MWRDWKAVRWLEDKLFEPIVEVKPIVEPRHIITEATAKSKKSSIARLGIVYGVSKSGREDFQGPEGFEFAEIENAYLTDSYIRQAVDKYIDFMFKAGWDFTGKNPKTVEYIKQRLSAMASATKTPTNQLFVDIAEELIKYHNVFIIKARAPNGYTFPVGIRVTPIEGQKKATAGYYVLPTSTVTIDRDVNGTVRKYQQEVTGTDKITVPADDVIHIYVDKQPGRAFGFPFLWEVLDDVKLLRQLEELVDRMIYKNIFPLMVYQVGLDKDGFQSTDEEIEEVKELLGELTMDGGIVLPERHNIKAVGAEGKALSVEKYLQYFEKRVFTGLGMSEMMMGRGDTANRSTSDNMDAAFKDRIKAYQAVMANFVNEFMIKELLMEGGYDPVLKEQDNVEFRFREIDFDSKIKEENHSIQKFTQNAITHEEMRTAIGMDPVADESRLYYNMITIPVEQASAVASSEETASSKSTTSSSKTPAKTTKKSESAWTDEFTSSLYGRWEVAKVDTIESIKRFYQVNPNGRYNTSVLSSLCSLTISGMTPTIQRYVKQSFMSGVEAAKSESHNSTRISINYDYNTQILSDRITRNLTSLFNMDLMRYIDKAVDKPDRVEMLSSVIGAFDALKYRLKFLATTETSKAYNAGFARAARALGYSEAYIDAEEGCEECRKYEGAAINLLSGEMPPYHPNCTCRLTFKQKEGS